MSEFAALIRWLVAYAVSGGFWHFIGVWLFVGAFVRVLHFVRVELKPERRAKGGD